MANILDIANFFLSKESMTQKKLQKLCYYSEAWSWALRHCSIVDEGSAEFQAWVHGPVNIELREKYKSYGWKDIEKNDEVVQGLIDAPDGVIGMLESVWNTYGDKDGDTLEILTHSEKPWIEAREGVSEYEPSNNVISTETMAKFYKSIYNGEK